MQSEEKSDKENLEKIQIYESMHGFDNKMPRIKTSINKNECAHMKRRIIFKIASIINKTMGLRAIVLSLKRAMNENKIKKIQWPTNDKIFDYYNAEALKNEETPVTNVTNREKQLKLIEECHNDRMRGGHWGQKRLYANLRCKFYWKNMAKDVIKFVRNCEKCKLNKAKQRTKGPMTLTPTPIRPFDVVIIDTIGPMSKTSSGNIYALTIVCELSKYLIMCPMQNKEAKTVAKTLFEELCLQYGTPKTIRSDLGTEYKNELIKELCTLLNIKHNFSTAYHHESLGSIERTHRVFNEYLRTYIDGDEWDLQIRYFTYCYNTTFHSSLNMEYTPFELIFARRANDISALGNNIDPIYNIDNYIKIMKDTLQVSYKRAKGFIERNKLRNKQLYDKNTHSIGNIRVNDKVLVKNEPYQKFQPIYSGPYRVKQVKNANLILEINNKPYEIHKNRVVKA